MTQRPQRLPDEQWSPRLSGPITSVPAETVALAVRILRLLPDIDRLTLATSQGDIVIDRQPSATAWADADHILMTLLASSPEVTSVTAHPFNAAEGIRRGSAEDPFLTRDGARAAAIRASHAHGEITEAEATRREQARLAGFDDDPLETLWETVAPPPATE